MANNTKVPPQLDETSFDFAISFKVDLILLE